MMSPLEKNAIPGNTLKKKPYETETSIHNLPKYAAHKKSGSLMTSKNTHAIGLKIKKK